MNRKGVALILAIGVVTVLSILAVSFGFNMRLEQQATYNYCFSVKAKYLAEAGIQEAIVELRNDAMSEYVDDLGDSWNSSLSQRFADGEYQVSVVDCARRVNINDTSNLKLRDVLGELAEQIGSPLSRSDGEDVFDNGPYDDKTMLKKSGNDDSILSDNKYQAIKDYITVFGEVDPDTVDPTSSSLSNAPRVPVNINTAEKEVLMALFIPLGISSSVAGSFADAIMSRVSTDSFQTRSEFNQYIDTLPGGITQDDAKKVKANFNPNTDIFTVDNNPNASWRGHAYSKKELSDYTTEFCFNSGGYYEITSTGRCGIDTDGDNVMDQTYAEKVIVAHVKVFEEVRHTTQNQFLAGLSGSSNKDKETNLHKNFGLQTYPEAVEANVTPAVYDGQIMLGTYEADSPQAGLAFFYATFDESIDANYSGSSTSADTSDPLDIASVLNGGNLLPDGLLVLRDDESPPGVEFLRYASGAAVSNDEGTIQMWLKPKWKSEDGPENSDGFVFDVISSTPGGWIAWQRGIIYWKVTTWGAMQFVLWDDSNNLTGDDNDPTAPAGVEHNLMAWANNGQGYDWEAGEWHYISATWGPGDGINLYIDGGTKRDSDSYGRPNPFETPMRIAQWMGQLPIDANIDEG